jgi:hypothetical protein
MRISITILCAALCGLAGCAAKNQVDFTPVASSPLPSMQKYNGYVGKDYWVTGSLQLCKGPTSIDCLEFAKAGAHLKVDGLVPNHWVDNYGTASDDPYFHIALDDGRSSFTDAKIFSVLTTTIDPVVAAAECNKKGDPKLGMNAKQVAATCWGPPAYVNTKIRITGKFEQYVYGDNKFVYLKDGIVTSISVKGRRPPNEFQSMR